jgi:hypothetical protein
LAQTPAIEPAPALAQTPAIEPAPALAQIPAVEPAPAVLPTEASPQPPLPAAPATPTIRQISVSRKYCRLVPFKYYEIIYLRHQLIVVVTELRDEDRIHVYK